MRFQSSVSTVPTLTVRASVTVSFKELSVATPGQGYSKMRRGRAYRDFRPWWKRMSNPIQR